MSPSDWTNRLARLGRWVQAPVPGRTGRWGHRWNRDVVAGQAALAVLIGVITTVAWALGGGGAFWPRWVWFGLAAVLSAEYLGLRVLAVPGGPRRWLALTRATVVLVAAIEVAAWLLSGGGIFWPAYSLTGWLIVLGVLTVVLRRRASGREKQLTERVATLAHTRQVALDGQAAELKRVERDLHDGAQARMVSLALTLGLAEDLLAHDPRAAARLLGEARTTAVGALDDLRSVMHSIHPAVLSDRGLVGAVRALALDLALPVTVTGEFPPDLAAPVESALYFAVAECLTNAVRHAGASAIEVTFQPDPRIVVADDGTGGADPTRGSGLPGIIGRLATVDARLDISSPPGGPTLMTITLPTDPQRG
ncbi:histidine kinase [Frankia sp. Ag45/Mut15]|uniref:histidine kinase n=1 Tax=Frankia umida TaxID=573489 RepID=A0ABT0JZQ4_9ACTN|nr:histidine kinase [Frankia umida]MCK9877012.1 histidine kinase [Frankia umida]